MHPACSSQLSDQISTRCYVEYMQRLLASYCSDAGIEGILAPHPDGHVGVFASPTEKVSVLRFFSAKSSDRIDWNPPPPSNLVAWLCD